MRSLSCSIITSRGKRAGSRRLSARLPARSRFPSASTQEIMPPASYTRRGPQDEFGNVHCSSEAQRFDGGIEGKQALFVVNLEPRKMRGVMSEGMLFDDEQ